MTIKYICDGCGKEKKTDRLIIKIERHNIDEYNEILGADICKDCQKEIKLIIKRFFGDKVCFL